MKIIDFDEIYTFVVQFFSFEIILWPKKRYTSHILVFSILIWVVHHFSLKMTSNEKV
jgi:hypothetical protein